MYGQWTQGSHVMFLMGSDFHYSNARLWCARAPSALTTATPQRIPSPPPQCRRRYQNLDKIIDLVNADGRVTAFYSNPIMCAFQTFHAPLTKFFLKELMILHALMVTQLHRRQSRRKFDLADQRR